MTSKGIFLVGWWWWLYFFFFFWGGGVCVGVWKGGGDTADHFNPALPVTGVTYMQGEERLYARYWRSWRLALVRRQAANREAALHKRQILSQVKMQQHGLFLHTKSQICFSAQRDGTHKCLVAVFWLKICLYFRCLYVLLPALGYVV